MTEPVTLSRAEYRVVYALCWDGASNAVIAVRVGSSVETVKTHIRAVLRKTGVTDRAQVCVAVWRGRAVIYPPGVGKQDLLTDLTRHDAAPAQP